MRLGRKGAEPKVNKPVELPRASFRRIEDEASTKPLGVHDLQARSYGYNSFDDWERPEYYIRYIEPIESELAVQVEYDMDEQDQEWLDALNKERKDQGLDLVSYETFEIIMDKLEKEWFDLMKRVPKPQTEAPPEDSTCAVCDDGEGENSNAIVFCDGCNLAVHQECYGIPYIPEGQWLCRKCTISPENPVSCVLCPAEAGAFKQTNTGKWVHLLCALWNPEVSVTKGAYMEPIEGIERISKPRWKLVCSICGIRKGACIQCQKASCTTAFHVTCARQQGLLGSMKSFAEEEHSLRVFCDRHLPPDMQKTRRIHTPPPASSSGAATLKSTKAALAHSSGYAPPAPIIPLYIYERVLAYIAKIRVLKKRDFLALVCKYWSLKREARRGAPLLKRLHLEPWTASSSNRHKTEEQKARQLQLLGTLRADIERVRIMAEYVIRREHKKMNRMEELQNTISALFFPFENTLHEALNQIIAADKMKYFQYPVDRNEVPDYYDIVKHPMDWSRMREKIKQHEYLNVEEFQNDAQLVFDNAMLYNAPESSYYKNAVKCKEASDHILASLNSVKDDPSSRQGYTNGNANGHSTSNAEVYGSSPTSSGPSSEAEASHILPSLPHINDLEPSLAVLQLLDRSDAIDTDDLDFRLLGTALDFLYFYGVTDVKPPPTPPPPPPKAPRNRAAEKQRKQEQREKANAAKNELLLQALSMPRTRGAKKAVEAAQMDGAEGLSSISNFDPAAQFESSEAVIDNGKPLQEDAAETIEMGNTAAAEESAAKLRRNRRGAGNLPAVPLILSDGGDMTTHGQFKHFDTGWVLDSRTRSGRKSESAAPPDSQPSRKRARQSEDASSMAPRPKRQKTRATASAEPLIAKDARASNVFSSDVSDVTESDEDEDVEAEQQAAEGEGDVKVIAEAGAEGTTRRTTPPTSDPHSTEGSGPNKRIGGRKPIVDGMYGKRGTKPPPVKDNDIDEEAATRTFQDGTLVWAKQDGYPWFPGEISVLDGPEMRDDIAEAKEQAEARYPGKKLWYVRFFDPKRTSLWVPAAKLHLLAESSQLDQTLLNGKMFKSAHLRQSVRRAYKDALDLMDRSGGANTASQEHKEEEPMDVAPVAEEGDENGMDVGS